MSDHQVEVNRPIRVVMFGGGPKLKQDAKKFILRLEEDPEIEFLGAFCQAQSQSLVGVLFDLWKRRRWLAIPLFFILVINKATQILVHPREEIAFQKSLGKILDRIHFVTDIHSQTVIAQVRALNPDLGLIYGSPILKPELFEIPRLGTLGIHHGKVPEYRGNKTTFWAMYNGENVAGVTIQKVNQGLDTGSIVKSAEVDTQGRTYQAVVHDLEKVGLDLFLQAILEVKDGTAEYKPQFGVKGTLYRNPKPLDFLKFWCRQLKRRVRMAK
ncbi:MAG TPA: formyl transferase [Anaerolineales bacterium]|nr:formyl transferase [Anaerolineales bacterium]